MVSLVDIAPPEVASKEVPIDRVGKVLTVVGLSALDIARLIKRFPKFRISASGRELSDDETMELGMDAGPAIIAMGLRSYDEETEKLVLSNLTLEEQQALLAAIMSLTNPEVPKRGAPFRGARAGGRGAASGRVQAGTSP